MADALPDTHDYARWKTALSGSRLPAAVVDMDAFDRNLKQLLDGLEGTPLTLRVATKSIRCTGLLRHIIEQGGPRIRGLMTWSAHECAMLAELGFDDMVCAYPVGRRDEAEVFARLAAEGRYVVAMVDDPHHVRLLAEAAQHAKVEIPLCIDLDVSWRPGADLHFGVRRSPVRDSEQVRVLAQAVAASDGVRLDGLMAYEAQVAGLQDRTRGSRLLDPVRAVIKSRSKPLAADRRGAAVATLKEDGFNLGFVNGGGTGSLRSTAKDPSVTEITVGSGFLCPHLFDGYPDLDLVPAAFFALGVVRSSDPDHVTCAGGGYIASGKAGADRSARVHAPAGIQPLEHEGFGEVQTPFLVTGHIRPDVGDPVLCRHAKAGELMERFDEILLVRGDEIVSRMPTYRGLGGTFF
jgi:D-serine deaminase-like pyridoxal phosphate-dependent protein